MSRSKKKNEIATVTNLVYIIVHNLLQKKRKKINARPLCLKHRTKLVSDIKYQLFFPIYSVECSSISDIMK